MRDRSDADLVAAHLAKEEGAFNEIYRRYYKKVFSTALKMTHDEEMAREIAQDVFHNISRSLAGWKSEYGMVNWLVKSTRNRTLEVLDVLWNRWDTSTRISATGGRVPGEVELADPQMDIFAELERKEFWHLIHEMLDQLPAEEREAFVLHEIEGLKAPEIGAMLGQTAACINSRVQRARNKARRILKDRLAA